MLSVRVRTQPIDGQANLALERLLARALALGPTAIKVAKGNASRLKAVEIDGLTLDEIKAKLAEYLLTRP